MLIEYSVANFASIHGEQRLAMLEPKTPSSETRPCALIYGPNASGKTTILQSIASMRRIVLESATRMNLSDPLPVIPFCLDKDAMKEPTRFEITLLLEGTRYRYGFSATTGHIVSEDLFVNETRRAQHWIGRRAAHDNGPDSFTFSPALKGAKDAWKKLTRKGTLFLSTAVSFNSRQLTRVHAWFYKSLDLVLPSESDQTPDSTWWNTDTHTPRVLAFLQMADPSIADLIHDDGRFLIRHKNAGSTMLLDVRSESEGIQRLFRLVPHIIEALDKGGMLGIDELDRNLHPLIAEAIIGPFLDKKTNKYGAQLIATLHNTYPIKNKGLDRNLVWFTEKDASQGTRLYPLSDTAARNNEVMEKSYFEGRYGAMPQLKTSSQNREEVRYDTNP